MSVEASDAILPPDFVESLDSFSTAQKKAMIIAIRSSIKRDLEKQTHEKVNFSQYVDVVKDFLPPDFCDDAIRAEVESLGLIKKTVKPQTQWLSFDSRQYNFPDNGHFKHEAKLISNFPAICDLMKKVNENDKTTQDANSALVIVYNSKFSGISFHDDAEKLMDSNSSISTVTFGESRDINFCCKSLQKRVPQHTINCSHHDIMIMKPGCQNKLVHQVSKGTNLMNGGEGCRIAISFRKVTPEVEIDPEISFGRRDSLTPQTPPERVTLIVGDSFSASLDADKLGRRGKKKVINVSSGGSTINDVSKQLDSYFLSAPDHTVVDKVFICVGANDIRNCRENGVMHLKSPLTLLVNQTKELFPDATVWFQNLVPLNIEHKFSVKNVEQFNKLLFEICSRTNVYILNVFRDFLIYNQHMGFFYRREALFKSYKNIHMNKFGMSILARRYLHLIHVNNFNPLGY